MTLNYFWALAHHYIWLIAGAILVIGLLLLLLARKFAEKLKEYEFNHRSKGGVVEFESYRHAKWHHRKHNLAYSVHFVGVVCIALAVVFVILMNLNIRFCFMDTSNACIM